jgi:hypothetical protein
MKKDGFWEYREESGNFRKNDTDNLSSFNIIFLQEIRSGQKLYLLLYRENNNRFCNKITRISEVEQKYQNIED